MIIKIKKAHSVLYFREITRKKSLQAQSNSSGKPDYNSYHHSFISSYGWDMHWSTCFYILDWFESEQFSRQVQQNVAVPVLLLLGISAIQLNFMGRLANRQLKREYFVTIHLRDDEPISSNLTRRNLAQTLTEKNTIVKQELTRKKRGFAIEKSAVDESKTNLENAQQEHQELIRQRETLSNTTVIVTQEERDQLMKGQHELYQRIEANKTNIRRLKEKLARQDLKKVHTLDAITQLENFMEQLNTMLKDSQKQVPVQYVESWLFNSFATNYHSMVNENIQIIKNTISYSQERLPSLYENVLTHLEAVKSAQDILENKNRLGITNQLEAWKNSVNNSKNVVEESFKDCLDMIKQYETALANYSLEIAYDKSQTLKHENVIDGTHERFIETITHLQKQLKQLDRKVFQVNLKFTRMQKNLQTDFKETLASLDREFKNSLLETEDVGFGIPYAFSKPIMNNLNKFGNLLNCIELNKQCLLELKTVCSQDISASEFSNSKLIQALVQHMNLEEFVKLRDAFLENENQPPTPKKLKSADSFSDFRSTLPTQAQVILGDFQREADRSAGSLSLNEMLTHLKEEDQISEDLNLESRSSMDSFKNKLDEQTDSSSPDTAAKIWSFFSKNFWAQYDEAIKKAKQEQKDYLLKLTQNQTLLASKNAKKLNVPFTTPSLTREISVSEKLEQELQEAERTIAKSYNENVRQLMQQVINSQNVEGNLSSMNPNTSIVSTSSSIRQRVFNLVYKIGEFTTKGLIMARLYEPIFYQAKSVLYQKPFEPPLPSFNSPTQTQSPSDFRQLEFNMSSDDKIDSKKHIINVHTRFLNPFSQLHVTRTNLDPLHSTVSRPLPAIGFHHNHYYAIEFKNLARSRSALSRGDISALSRGDIPVVREDQFLRFIGNRFTSEWLTLNHQFHSAIKNKEYERFSQILNVSQYNHQNRNINNQLDKSLSTFMQQYQAPPEDLDRITEIAKMDQENPQRQVYLKTLQDQICEFGRAYQKLASFPIFQLGSQHYHKSSRSDPQAISSDNFFQKYLQPFISNDQTGAVDFLELLSEKYFQGIEESQRTRNTITNFIKNHVMPLSPYAPKPEQAAPNQTPQQANGFIFHNLKTDQYELCQQSKVYQDIQSDLMRVERVLQMRDDIDWQKPKSRTQAQDFSKLYATPLYHPLFTPYLVDATTSELMHILRSHRFPGVPNLTQPFRASRFEFNVHLDECARHIQHQKFFEELGNLLVREDYVQRTGPKKKAQVELRNRTEIYLREKTPQEEIKRAYRFHEYVLPSHLLTTKTIIISHILLALKYSIQFSGTIPS